MPFNTIPHRPSPLPANRARSRNPLRHRRTGTATGSRLLPAILLLLLLPLTAGAQTTDICDRHDAVEAGILGWFLEPPPCTAVDLSQVESLRISGGITEANPVQASDFAGLTNLEDLTLISQNTVFTLPADLLRGLTNLSDFTISHSSGLTTLPATFFQGLSNLSDISISQCSGFTTLPANLFQGLGNLTSIYFFNNQIAALPTGMFQGLTGLTEIDVSYNQLSGALPAGLFAGLTNLEQIILENNQITGLPAGIFDGLVNLREIALSNNDIAALPAGIFADLRSLTRLDLNEHRIATLPDGIFAGLFKVTNFSLLHADATRFDLSADMAANAAENGVIFSIPKGAPESVDLDITVEETGDSSTRETLEIIFPAGHTQYRLPPDVLHDAGFAADTAVTIALITQRNTDLSGINVVVSQTYSEDITVAHSATPDANDDNAVDASDALILYYAYSLRSSLGTGR